MATGQAFKCDSCGSVDIGNSTQTDLRGPSYALTPINWFDIYYFNGKRGNLCSIECLTAWAEKVEAEALSGDTKDA